MLMKKRAKVALRPAEESRQEIETAGYWTRFEAFLETRATWLAVALVVLASIRIVSTYLVFSHTFDEPAHIACGMEWLDKGVYTWEPQHPPLARVAAAIGPYLMGVRSQNTPRVDIYSMT